jgi:outer membrane protein insertion porin family
MRSPRRGWFNDLEFEAAPSGFGGAFTYRIVKAHLRRYNVVFGRHSLNFRLSFARSGGTPPLHRRFSLGGVGTLRGTHDLSERGTDYLLGNVEYRFPIRGIDWRPFRMAFGALEAVLFFDAGNAWTGPWHASDLRADAGAGISGANIFSYFGLYIARAIDGSDGSPRITVRMERDF